MQRRKTVWIAIIVGLMVICVVPARARKDANYQEFNLLALIIEKIRVNYVKEVEDKDLFTGALDGVVSTLDPYSQYLPPREADQLKVDTEGEYGGLGIVITVRNRQLTVITPMEDSPAFRAGILAGDKILAIDGRSTEGITIHKAVDTMRGKSGTKVKLTILQEGATKTRSVTLIRSRIEIQSIKGITRLPDGSWDYWADKDEKIGYVRATQFQQKTITKMDKVVNDLVSQGLRALIVDLRFNSGGLLNVAIEMSDRFVSDGIIVFTRGRAQEVYKEYKGKSGDDYPDFPLVVLINGGSASASEIVAGCLQDRKRAILVGTRSFGKGSVQSIIPLAGKHTLKLTTARYYTPSGRSIHREEDATEEDEWGVTPDIVVKISREDQAALWQTKNDADVIQKEKTTKEEGGEEKPEIEKPAQEKPAPKARDVQLDRAVEILKAIDIYQKLRK